MTDPKFSSMTIIRTPEDLERFISEPARVRDLAEGINRTKVESPDSRQWHTVAMTLRACAGRIEGHERTCVKERLEAIAREHGITIDWNGTLRDFAMQVIAAESKGDTVPAPAPEVVAACEYLHCGEPGGCPTHSPGRPVAPDPHE